MHFSFDISFLAAVQHPLLVQVKYPVRNFHCSAVLYLLQSCKRTHLSKRVVDQRVLQWIAF
jgi:hypothetical protein